MRKCKLIDLILSPRCAEDTPPIFEPHNTLRPRCNADLLVYGVNEVIGSHSIFQDKCETKITDGKLQQCSASGIVDLSSATRACSRALNSIYWKYL